ncbi:unnamed protein product [Rhizophagus irregularis]|nr:unnamed protein product [Rhizophagus irregularis]
MRHLQHLLFGIILLSSFGSAFADDYDPRQDVFDQVINALVPTLIVFLNFKEADEKKLLSSINEESEDVIKQEDVEIQQNGAEESEDVRKQGDVEIQQNGAKKRGWKKQLKNSLHDYGYRLPSKIKDFLNNVVVDVIGVHFGKFLITITFLWTPIVQMLNMALLSGNDYYWTKLILALNLIYISRVLYYTVEKKFSNLDKAEFFGLLNIIFYLRHKI